VTVSTDIQGHEAAFLESEGIDPSQVHMQLIQSETSEGSLLAAGKIDAFTAGPPLAEHLAAQGKGVVMVRVGTAPAWAHRGSTRRSWSPPSGPRRTQRN
jgi:ABC-type nitrate/sulfonate/bicarbonate transport system substrate-binding protein